MTWKTTRPCREALSPFELHFRNGGLYFWDESHRAEDKLYRFNNPDLLVQAPTHPSTDSKPKRAGRMNGHSWETPFFSWPSQYLFFTCPNPRKGN